MFKRLLTEMNLVKGQADKDSDGTLDKVEAKAFPKLLKNFDKIDTDNDCTISQAEKTYKSDDIIDLDRFLVI